MGTESRTALFRAAAIALAVTAGACADGLAPTGSDADLARNSVIRVTPDSVVLTVGQRQQLGVADTGSVKRVQWAARDTAIATVTTDGVVEGRAVGTTYVIGKRTGSADSARVQVVAGTVTPPATGDTTATTGGTTSGGSTVTIASLTIDPSSASIGIDATVQLNAIAKDVSGNVVPATVAWSSANPSVATVSSTGLVKGVAAGTAAVTATADGKTSSINVTVTAPTAPTTGGTAFTPGGIWMSPEELKSRPTSGAAWDALRYDAARDPGAAAITDQHSTHDTYTMAAALVCARTGEYCDKAKNQLIAAMGSETGADWHSVARNLGAYVIAADVMGLRADGNASSLGTKVQTWIGSFLTRNDIKANAGEPVQGYRRIGPFHSGSNSAAQEGFVHAAVAAYMHDKAALDRAWDAFRTFSCEPGAPDRENIDLRTGLEWDWEHSETAPCAINPKGTTKTIPAGRPGAGMTVRIDGAIINDMRRGGMFQWEPGWTQYPWTGLQGYVPAALLLYRAGYPAFEVADRAVYRTHEYLKHIEDQTSGDWFDGVRGAEVIQLVNWYYKSSFPMNKSAIGASRTFGYSDWTHPKN